MKGILKEFKIVKNLFIFFIVVLLLNCETVYDNPVLIGNEAKWLKYNAVKVSNIWSSSTNFSDLQPLKTAISDARIVMLGEQTHGDGTTFSAKIRLVKFLHQEMGFDVVAFESGLYDCHRVWLDILNGEDPKNAARKGIFRIWSNCRDMRPLFDYIGDALYGYGLNTLEIAGFDCQFSGIKYRIGDTLYGNNSTTYLVDDLENFLNQNNAQILNHDDWPPLKEILQIFAEEWTGRNPDAQNGYVPEKNNQAIFFNMLKAIQEEVGTFRTPLHPLLQSSAFWQQVLKSIQENAKSKWYSKPEDYINLRDAQMADNLLWLYRNVYKDRKMIVWASTYHIQRNINEITDYYGCYPGWIPMGEIVWQTLGDEIYSIGFTGYQGTFRDIRSFRIKRVPPSSKGSLEYFMNEAEFNFGIIEFRHLTDDGAWLKNPLLSRPLSNVEMKANWTRVLDAMFFIRDMRHSTF